MEFRPAVEADLPGEYEAFVAAQRELHDRHSVPWSATPFERWSTVHRHLLEHDGERSFVAEENGRIAGFSSAWVRDRTEAIQPVSTGLYARRGLIPATPPDSRRPAASRCAGAARARRARTTPALAGDRAAAVPRYLRILAPLGNRPALAPRGCRRRERRSRDATLFV